MNDSEFRALGAAADLFELREDAEASERAGFIGQTLTGHFAVFDQWTEINSRFEGQFLERIAPGAFEKTFAENRANMRVLFDHGHDPAIGNKVLGPIRELRSEDSGAYYEVPLYDTSYTRDLLPGLADGQYGASFRFRAMKEDWIDHPEESDYNPNRLRERTITEAKVMEFGPVTFPAYAGASAGLRSITDEVYRHSLEAQLRKFFAEAEDLEQKQEPLEEPQHSESEEPSRSTRVHRDYLAPRRPRKSWELPERGPKQ